MCTIKYIGNQFGTGRTDERTNEGGYRSPSAGTSDLKRILMPSNNSERNSYYYCRLFHLIQLQYMKISKDTQQYEPLKYCNFSIANFVEEADGISILKEL